MREKFPHIGKLPKYSELNYQVEMKYKAVQGGSVNRKKSRKNGHDFFTCSIKKRVYVVTVELPKKLFSINQEAL